jgi:hypothetical protein
MNTYQHCRAPVRAAAFIPSILAATFCVVNVGSAKTKTYSDLGLTHYLHHKLGIHDYLHGPGGVIPRLTGLPEQVPTQHEVSFLHGTYPVGPYRRRVYPQNRVAQRVVPAGTTRFDDLNLTVKLPSGPWRKLDPQQTGTKACFLASRTNPAIVISLAGEPVGVELGATNDSLLSASQAKMMGLPGATIESGEEQQSAGRIRGIAYQATVPQEDFTGYYSVWVAAHHGYNYKLAVYGDQQDKPAIDAAMQDFLRGLKQIQSNRIARGPAYREPVAR